MASADAIFPPGFVWGAATAAYQIEGAVNADGRGPSIWDAFSHTPGKTVNGDTGDVACDHYHRFREDVALMRALGLGAYRFSIAWPRILPTGTGKPNPAGVDFYRRLIDTLRGADIEPFVTLYHWDLPQPLQDAGGWANRDTVGRFGEFAHAVAVALGSEVHRWITINEPWVVAFLGHLYGLHAPGIRDLATALQVAHHQLLAHAEAMAALRAESGPDDQVGIALNLTDVEPADDGSADAEAAERYDGYYNRWFLDPLFRGRYPDDLNRWYGDAMPEFDPGDLARINRPVDFLGVNYYSRAVVAHDRAAAPVEAAYRVPPGSKVTAMGWEVSPAGLSRLLVRLKDDYAPAAIYITENGAAYDDRLIDSAVDDPEREAYLHEHLLEAHRAIGEGVPLRGYFAWSLLDNFEWAFGYSKRFGLVYVDFPTQTRIIKRSGRWYGTVTREHGVKS